MSGKRSRAFNLGTGMGLSVVEVINAVETVTSSKVEVKVLPRREGDPPVLVADNRDAKKFLKWEPRHSDINTILKSAYDFDMNLSGME